MARRYNMPPGGRYTSANRITITIPCIENGQRVRKSHSKVKPDEPKTYANLKDANEGYDRVIAYRDQRTDHAQTVRGFWQEWTDADHWMWGAVEGRSEQTLMAYATRTRKFVERYGDRPIDTITEFDVRAYMADGAAQSSLYSLSTMFNDAEREGLITTHPCRELAKRAERTIRTRRKNKPVDVPDRAQIDAVLERAGDDVYPDGLRPWLIVGTETGMRGGELDGMEWKYLKGDRYQIDWQWNAALGKMTPPKHESYRSIGLSDVALEAIESCRGRNPRYVFTNKTVDHFTHDSRDWWWAWNSDGGPSLRQLVGGVTMYAATRHYWASRAVNELGLSPYQASLLYGHKDGGRLITEVYAKPDHERAVREAQAAMNSAAAEQRKVVDLEQRRREQRA